MAGMAGIVSKRATSKKVGKMLNQIRHRGKDNSLVQKTSLGSVGFVGVDLSSHKSIGYSAGKGPQVVIDGALVREDHQKQEISDAEYLKQLYAAYGKKAFSQVKGSFACAVLDEQECVIARDHVGARPLIYSMQGGEFVFASEGKSLTKLTDEVDELPPGHYYSTRDGLQPFQQESLPKLPDCGTKDGAIKAVRESVIDAISQAMENGKLKAVALSGGLDSSIILSVAREFNKDLLAFSATLDENPGEDLEYAKMMAKYTGAEHHIYRITRKDIENIIPKAVYHLESFDEDCISGFIANYYTSRLASEHVNSVLVGEGADELFGGYFRELKDIDDPEEKERVGKRLVEVAYNTALRRLDRAWMANGVEYFAPFIDPVVVAVALSVPMEYKVYQGEEPIEKWVLREAFRDMLPQEIADRPKMRFARGVGVDFLMDKAVEKHVSSKDYEKQPKSKNGMDLNSPKELYYYQLFQKHFPQGYEGLTGRWDPFK